MGHSTQHPHESGHVSGNPSNPCNHIVLLWATSVCCCRITFLYKMIEGTASSSFGLNVARLACLPESVVLRAGQKARHMGGSCDQHRSGPVRSTSLPA